MSAPTEDAARGTGRAARRMVSRRVLLEVTLQSFLTLASSATCFLALWLVPRRAGRLLSAALDAAGGEVRASHREGVAGGMFVAYSLLLVGGFVLASGAVPPSLHEPAARHVAAFALGVMLPAVISVACAPFALAPLALLDGAGGIAAAIARSFELAARRGPLASARDAGLAGAAVGGALGLVGLAVELPGSLWLVALVGLVALATAILSGVALALARTYVVATGAAALAGSRPPGPAATPRPSGSTVPPGGRVAGRLGAVLGLLVPSVAAVGAALLVALATPAPMSVAPFPDVETDARDLVVHGRGAVTIPGPHGISLRARAGGVSIEAADGGGAGYVAVGPAVDAARYDDAFPAALVVLRARFRGRGAFAAHTPDRWGGGRVVYFDDQGVRLDDDLSDRISARVHHNAIAALCAGLLLAMAWGLRVMRALGDARALDAPAITLAEPAPSDAMGRLVGRLRLGSGSVVRLRDARARVDGDARVVSRDGDVVVRLPPEVRLFAPHDASVLPDGAEVEVVGHLGTLAPTGLREGALEWPAGARLLVGQRADAADRLVTRAARGGAVVAAIVAALLVGVAVSILASL